MHISAYLCLLLNALIEPTQMQIYQHHYINHYRIRISRYTHYSQPCTDERNTAQCQAVQRPRLNLAVCICFKYNLATESATFSKLNSSAHKADKIITQLTLSLTQLSF